MKFIGDSIETKNLGYFGIRQCEVCGGFWDVDLIEVKKVFRFCFFAVKTYAVKRFLCCQKCNACFEISPDLWSFYQTYQRFNKKTTDEIIDTLKRINNEFVSHGTFINLDDKIYHGSLDTIHESLAKKYGHEEYLEELISIYFSSCNKQINDNNEKKPI